MNSLCKKGEAEASPFFISGNELTAQRHLLGDNLREVGLLEAVDLFVEFVDLA